MSAMEFGVAFALYNNFSAEAERIKASMQGLEGETAKTFQNITKSMDMMAMGAGLLTAGGGILAGLFKASEVRAEFQAYETQFETLLGSADKASEMMKRVKQDAKDNPIFGTESLVAANAAILATGRMTEDASRSMVNNIANVLAGAGKGDSELIRMSANLNGIVGTGKATMQDMNQFVMAGVPIWKLMEDATGKTKAELQQTGVSAEELAEALAHASAEGGMFYKATERAALTTKGLKAAVEDGIVLALVSLGAAIEPITRVLYQMAGILLDIVEAFLNSPLGKVIVNIVAAMAGLAVVLGVILILKGGLKFSLISLTRAFSEDTRATLMNAIAKHGYAGGLKAVAAATWKTIAPTMILLAKFLLIAAVGYAVWKMIDSGSAKLQFLGTTIGVLSSLFLGWASVVVVVGMWLYKGFQIWNDGMDEALSSKGGVDAYVESLSDLQRAFASVFGVLAAVSEIWSSWNGETYEISEETAQKLEALGLTDFVHNLAAGIATFQEFFKGLWDGLTSSAEDAWYGKIKPVFDAIWEDGLKPIWESIKKSFLPIWNKLFGDDGMSGTDGAKDAGLSFGTILGLVFHGLGKVLEFLYPILIVVFQFIADYIIPILAFWVNLIVDLIGFIWEIAKVVWKVIKWVVGIFFSLLEWLWEKAESFREAGAKLFGGLWDGLKDVWASIKEWISEKVGWIADKISNAIKGAIGTISSIGKFFGIGDDEDDVGDGSPNPTPFGGKGGGAPIFNPITSKTPAFGRYFGGAGATNFSSNPTINVTLDGDMIASSIQTRQEMSKARS